MAYLLAEPPPRLLAPDEVWVFQYHTSLALPVKSAVIEREMNNLGADEIRQHQTEVNQAILKELQRWVERGSFQRLRRSEARNLIDSRWVLKWKLVDGRRVIKARLTVRGFKDLQAHDLKTFAATASRWGQRAVAAMVA